MKTLHPPQVAHAQRLLEILETNHSAADLSPCGLGKTVCAAEIAKTLGLPLFVVAPLSTLPSWKEELMDRDVDEWTIVNYEGLRSKKENHVTKDRMGRWSWQIKPNSLVVFDEAQRLKSYDSIISKIGIAARPFKTLLLSGSMAESPVHLRCNGYLLGLHDLRTYLPWARSRGCSVNIWGKLEFNDDKGVLDRLHRDIIPTRGSQMTFEEMKAFMPDNKIMFQKVDFGDKGGIDKLYKEMATELAILDEVSKADKRGAEALTAILRARQHTELLKVPLLAERAADMAAEGFSVAVFLTYTASLNALSERMGGIPIISGQHGDREAVIQGFRADKTPVIGVNLAAGGAGINLHGKRARRSLLAPDYNPIHIEQAFGRLPRVGGGDVIQYVLTASGTIEDQVKDSLLQKLKNIRIINHGLQEND